MEFILLDQEPGITASKCFALERFEFLAVCIPLGYSNVGDQGCQA